MMWDALGEGGSRNHDASIHGAQDACDAFSTASTNFCYYHRYFHKTVHLSKMARNKHRFSQKNQEY